MDEQSKQIVTVEQDDIIVEIDTHYMRSWPGIRQAAHMQSSQLSESDRFFAMVEYYENICPNIDDINDALIEKSPYVDANDVFRFIADAVKKATPKN